jgi:hypothetical protein
MGGVIANAVSDAIGIRVYELLMTPARVLGANDAANWPAPTRSIHFERWKVRY